jgi:hypothetical protein
VKIQSGKSARRSPGKRERSGAISEEDRRRQRQQYGVPLVLHQYEERIKRMSAEPSELASTDEVCRLWFSSFGSSAEVERLWSVMSTFLPISERAFTCCLKPSLSQGERMLLEPRVVHEGGHVMAKNDWE